MTKLRKSSRSNKDFTFWHTGDNKFFVSRFRKEDVILKWGKWEEKVHMQTNVQTETHPTLAAAQRRIEAIETK